MEKSIIGIDLGGTFIKGALLDFKGNIITRKRHPTEVNLGKNRVIENILTLINDLSSQAGPVAAGIGIPGIITPHTGMIVKSPNFPGWEEYPIKAILQEKIPLPITVDNDANCAAMGERWLGAGKDHEHFILLTLGTGIGGGIILGGKIWKGVSGRGGELGHIMVELDGRQCGCGSRGCLEAYASGSSIVKIAREEAYRNKSGRLWEKYLSRELEEETLTPRIIYHEAMAGDELSKQVYRQAGMFLGAGIGSLINILDIHTFVIGGGVAEGLELMIGAIKDAIGQHTFGIDQEKINILKAGTGEDAGVIGAAYISMRQCSDH